MGNFGHHVRKFNTWFINQHNEIVREVGKEGCTEYLRSLFCVYKTAKDVEFLKTVKAKETEWVARDLLATYVYKDLLAFAFKLYNNKKATSKWEGSMQKKPTSKDTKFLAMMTNLEQLKKAMEIAGVNPMPKFKTRDTEEESGPRFRPWQFENKEGKETLQAYNRTYRWCTNNCHPKPMWCTCTNCLNRADFAAKMAKEKEGGGRGGDTKKMKATNDFCIALPALVLGNSFKALKMQFLK
eukprot:12834136-Ditylum_brightwellii.AAC.2